MSNYSMDKSPGRPPGMAPKLMATPTKSKPMGIVVSKSPKGKPMAKSVGRRISQHKRLAMGEKI